VHAVGREEFEPCFVEQFDREIERLAGGEGE